MRLGNCTFEMLTRIITQPLPADAGDERVALDSVYSLFTRCPNRQMYIAARACFDREIGSSLRRTKLNTQCGLPGIVGRSDPGTWRRQLERRPERVTKMAGRATWIL